ncbi:MAG: 4Fe-4S binding protein [Bacteroidota bacterium]
MKAPVKGFDFLKIPLISLMVFIAIGLIVWWFRHIMYFYLFTGIGFLDFSSRILIYYFPKSRQIFRLSLQFTLGSFLLIWLGLIIGVNFQFPEIFFDAYSGIITGALIQLTVARLILPFFLGNGFCSRACWTGFFFEMTNTKSCNKEKIKPRSNLIAWTYLITLIVISFFVAFNWNPAMNIETRKWWIIGENLFITSIGFILSFFIGSRAYCRMLCPFLTISGLISPFSLFKITPVNTNNCSNCQLCNKNCPMLINVSTYVQNNKRINDPTCILCERCISSCKENVLKLTTKDQLSKNGK